MNKQKVILMAAFGLIMSALSVSAQVVAPSATIKISSLPFTVTTPGTYVLTGNLTCTVPQSAAITIPGNLPGQVVVDLKGFTITGDDSASSTGIGIGPSVSLPNAFPITVRNGAITNVSSGVSTPSLPGVQSPGSAGLQDILIANLNISGVTACVSFSGVENSVVRNCTFSNAAYGIEDWYSPGGNRYDNITVEGVGLTLYVPHSGALEDCEFAPPAAQ
jgi:hypothetical protein